MAVTPTGLLPGVGRVRVAVHEGRVSEVVLLEPVTGWDEDAASEGVVLPGLVDLQVNGFDGVDFNDPDLRPADVLTVAEALWAHGVTQFCPTTITGPLDVVGHTVSTVRAARSTPGDPRARSVLGVHLEGPWISPVDGARGAHPVDHTRPADADELDTLAGRGEISVITVAPEVPGALRLIEHAVGLGIRVSLGHSDATPDQIRAGIDAGATLSTHLGNGAVSPMPRHPNLIWEQLAQDRLTAMFIADLHHLDLSTLRAMTRAKGADRVVLVSDATSLAGRPPGRYTTPIGGTVVLGDDGRLSVVGTSYLAGAAVSLMVGLSNVLAHRVLDPVDAVLATSLRPASFVAAGAPPGWDGRTGAIDLVGRRADLVLAHWDPAARSLVPTSTYVEGVLRWRRP